MDSEAINSIVQAYCLSLGLSYGPFKFWLAIKSEQLTTTFTRLVTNNFNLL